MVGLANCAQRAKTLHIHSFMSITAYTGCSWDCALQSHDCLTRDPFQERFDDSWIRRFKVRVINHLNDAKEM